MKDSDKAIVNVAAPVLAIATSSGTLIASAPALPFLLAGAAIAAIAYAVVETSKE